MLLLLISCLSIGNAAAYDVKFLAAQRDSVVTIPGAHSIARDIAASLSDFRESGRNISIGKTAGMSSSKSQEQFHGVVWDSQGGYYTQSMHAHMCEISEKLAENYFYESIPSVFYERNPRNNTFIPCLADGIPTPKKAIQRCENETCELAADVKDGTVTRDGHLIYEQSTAEQTGWYRCRASNMCGSITTTPMFIEIREEAEEDAEEDADEDAEEEPRPGFVISKRTSDFEITHVKQTGDDKEEIEFKRTVTLYELWRLDTTTASFSDEAVFQETRPDMGIYFLYYPTHDSQYGSSTDLSFTGHVNTTSYCVATHNNSFITSMSNSVFTAFFDTDIIHPPHMSVPDDEIFISPTVVILEFKIGINEKFKEARNVKCFKNTVKLTNSWKTKQEVLDTKMGITIFSTIAITIFSPIALDSGYYQCGVQYDVFYISDPVFIKIDNPKDFYHPISSDVSSNSVQLQWETPEGYNGVFVVFLSDHAPAITTKNSKLLSNLTPYKKYTWHIETPSQNPVSDMLTFKTQKDIPTAGVGPVSVVRLENSLKLSWREYPRTSWFDDRIYFTVESLAVNSTKDSNDVAHRFQSHVTHTEAAHVQGLDTGTTYRVTITACNSVGCSKNTRSLNVTTKHFELNDTPEIKVLFIAQTTIEVAFSSDSANEVYLELFTGDLCRTATPTPSNSLISITPPRAKLGDLFSFTKYSARIRVTNGYSTSPWSECVTFKTNFNWRIPVIPVICISVLLVLVVVLRAVVKSRCPDVVNKLKQALEPKYVNIMQHGREEWETSNDVAIIHSKFEECDL